MASIPEPLLAAATAAITAAKRKYPTLSRAGFDSLLGEPAEPPNLRAVALALAFIQFGGVGKAKVPWGSAGGRLAYFARRWAQALGFEFPEGIKVGDVIVAALASGVKIERP